MYRWCTQGGVPRVCAGRTTQARYTYPGYREDYLGPVTRSLIFFREPGITRNPPFSRAWNNPESSFLAGLNNLSFVTFAGLNNPSFPVWARSLPVSGIYWCKSGKSGKSARKCVINH